MQLADVRARRRLLGYQDKMTSVLDSNRRAIGRLYTTGALFSRQGSRAGRDLLLAHQHLLRVVTLLEQLSAGTDGPVVRSAPEAEMVYRQLDRLLDRTSELTHRTGHYLERLRGD